MVYIIKTYNKSDRKYKMPIELIVLLTHTEQGVYKKDGEDS